MITIISLDKKTTSKHFLLELKKFIIKLIAENIYKNKHSYIWTFINNEYKITDKHIKDFTSNSFKINENSNNIMLNFITTVKIKNIPLTQILNLIDYGSLDAKGIHIFDSTFKYIQQNIGIFIRLYRLRGKIL